MHRFLMGWVNRAWKYAAVVDEAYLERVFLPECEAVNAAVDKEASDAFKARDDAEMKADDDAIAWVERHPAEKPRVEACVKAHGGGADEILECVMAREAVAGKAVPNDSLRRAPRAGIKASSPAWS
jgi:hypothetical protein